LTKRRSVHNHTEPRAPTKSLKSDLGDISKKTGYNLGYFEAPEIGSFTINQKLAPRTAGQKPLLAALRSKSPITMVVGPPGAGKTFMAIGAGLERLAAGLVDKIVITRPAVESDENLGFIPGGIDSKMLPYVLPIIECCVELIGGRSTRMLFESGAISIRPFAFMRGSTFTRTFVFADEMSNSTVDQMKCLLTRFGLDSKLVIAGDPMQSDLKKSLPAGQVNGLQDLISRTDRGRCEAIERVNLSKRDIVRHPLIAQVLSLYGDER
jgi:phosphate starvation-inducible protein PhoH and related proteins